MQTALVRMPFEMLHRVLGLPDDVRIVAATAVHDLNGALDLRLEGKGLPHVSPGERIPHVRAVCGLVDGALVTTLEH
jgi:hypothetical protein